MTSKNIKIYKLKPTDGPLSRDDLSTWVFTVKSYSRQHGMIKFISGDNKNWIASDIDDSNGHKVIKQDGSQDVAETNKLVGEFHDFLTTVAANCPSGFTETVIRESTSFDWIIDHIKKTFKLTTKGQNFLDCQDIKFVFDENFTYNQGLMQINDHFISSLLPAGAICMGKALQAKEVLSPLARNFMAREWLIKIDPRLPEHVRNTRGHLFTEERPTLACNQAILCDQMEVMLQELDAKDGTSSNSVNVGNVGVGYVPSHRGRGFPPTQGYHGGYRGAFVPRGPRPMRARGPQPVYRPSAPPRRSPSCQICLEARKYDSALGHTTSECPFKNQLRSTSQRQPNFKVLLVPTQPTLPTSNTPNLANVSTDATNPYDVQFNYQYADPNMATAYPDQFVYEDQLYTAPFNHYEQATIEEVPGSQQQPL